MATINRRKVLYTGATGAAAATVTSLFGLPTAMAAPASGSKATTTLMARSRWAGLVGSTFSMRSPVATWQVRLEEIGDLFPVLEPADEERFSLSFSSAQAGPPQGIFTFARPGFEPTRLFVIPDGERRRYLAIVSRL